jgi:ribonuclease HI
MAVEIYTDGACRGNPGKGGYGIVMKNATQRKELSAGYRLTTNNRMELLSVIIALQTMKKFDVPITVFSDSKYVVDAINLRWVDGWVKKSFKGKKNKDLWLQFLALRKQFSDLKFIWVKGHASNAENNRCDELATAAADGNSHLVDEEYGHLGENDEQTLL